MIRYRYYLISIFYFHPVSDYTKIESLLKKKLKNKRIKNENGRHTEWIILELPKIILCINEIINQYECNDGILNKYDFNNYDSDESSESDEHIDPICLFINKCLTKTTDYDDKIQNSDLYNEYKVFVHSYRQKHAGTIEFKKILSKNEINSFHTRTGKVYNYLIFKNRPSEQNKNAEIEIIDV